jgi:glutathione S-transferase
VGEELLNGPGRRGGATCVDGPNTPQALVRCFGTNPKEITLTFFRDGHGWCLYCHKVWLMLELKGVPYRVNKVCLPCYGNKDTFFVEKINETGQVPAICIDAPGAPKESGQVYRGVTDIYTMLETTYPASKGYRSLLPSTRTARAQSRRCLEKETKLCIAFMNFLRLPGHSGNADYDQGLRQFEQAMTSVDKLLQESPDGPFFLGSKSSYLDCRYAPIMERIAPTILYYKGVKIKGGKWKNINAWFAAIEQWDAYLGTMGDFYSHCHDFPAQIGQCYATGETKQVQSAKYIDGHDGSWSLPLSKISSTSLEPMFVIRENERVDRLEAACAVLRHHVGLVRLMMQNQPGGSHASKEEQVPTTDALNEKTKSVSTTKSNQEKFLMPHNDARAIAADYGLRCVVQLLVTDWDRRPLPNSAARQQQQQPFPDDTNSPWWKKMNDMKDVKEETASNLRYLRDRVCVPRDMSYLAARQLRAHLNHVADSLDPDGVMVPNHVPQLDRSDQDPAHFKQFPLFPGQLCYKKSTQ